MITGKSRGFKKGDFVLTPDGNFPAIIISDVHTFAPCCEVWGFEQEMGSTYAEGLKKITFEEFLGLCQQYGHERVYANSEVGKQAIKDAMAARV